nr:uncharacterized protein LOC119161995 [Rhipicephalus microplus]
MVATFLPIFRSCAHGLTAEQAVPLKIIFLNQQFFIFLLLVLVQVFCEENTTLTLLSAPFKTSENEPTNMPSSFTTSEAPTSLGKVNKSHLLMFITSNAASGARTLLNFSGTSKLPGTIGKQTATKTKLTATLEHATSSIKPKLIERAHEMNTEKEAVTSSTRPTSRSLIDIMPTEVLGYINTSSSALPEMEPTPKRSKFLSDIQTYIKQLMSTVGSELTRNLLKADLSTDCTVGLLHFTRAIQDLEPWALRLIDATAKYPTGLLQGTMSDLGAYDECIETVVQDEYGATTVRGQYCDVHLSILDQEAYNQVTLQAIINFNKRMARFKSYLTDKNLPGIRLGVCVIDACREQDLANIGSVLAGSFMKVTVKDCVTNVYEGMSFVQACIIAFLVVLAAVIASGTIFELFAKNWDCERNKATFYKCVSAFSLVSNSNRILQIMEEDNPEKRRYRFAYGLRFLSMFWICLGHSYGMINENITRIFNAVYIFETWESPIISAAFMAVDTFFFMSGYLLYLTLSKQKGNRAIIAVVAIIRRFIR